MSTKRYKPTPRGTHSQPIPIESPPSSPRPSPRRALVKAPQAPGFEARLRDSQPEAAIIPPTEGSEEATKASDEPDTDSFDERLEDNFEGIDWDRLPRFIKPIASQRHRKSWIYSHGYRVALQGNPQRIYFVCRFCHQHKYIDAGVTKVYETTNSTSSVHRHLAENRRGHNHQPPNKTGRLTAVSALQQVLTSNRVSQKVANELSGFNTQRFRLNAVGWLVDANLPLSTFESPAFRQLIASANPQAEVALWASHNSVSSYVIRLYDYLRPHIVAELSQAQSKIHISFDGWTTKGGKRGFLGIVAHYVDRRGDIRDLPIALPQLTGAHSGEIMATVVTQTLTEFGITASCIGYFVLDNASNNDTAVDAIARTMGFNPLHRRLRCSPHTINLVGQVLLWGKDGDSYNNNASEIAAEGEYMGQWRRDGPLGVLLAVVNYIKTPQQYALFADFQRLAHRELPPEAPAEQRRIFEPVKPVVTRWNSFYSCFERAIQLQSAVNAYASHHIKRVRDEDTYAESRRNKLPDAPRWMRSGGLTADDWAVITEYMDALKPLKAATKRLEGRGNSGRFGCIAEVIPVFEYILTYYEQRVQLYEAVDYNAHNDAPEDHLAINMRAAWAKASDYYAKLDLSPAYYAATILHPYYRSYCDKSWVDKPEWLAANNRSFRGLWDQYNTGLPAVRRPKVLSNDMDDAIDGLIDPTTTSDGDDAATDEYSRWKACEQRVEKGSEYANNPIKYWLSLQDRYPYLSKLALDVLSIPASSCECERMFSELGDLLEPRRRGIQPQLLAAIQCVRRWRRAGLGDDKVNSKVRITDDQLDAAYGVATWDDMSDSDTDDDCETQHQD